jgi:ligand-binding sensor domain-containing protein
LKKSIAIIICLLLAKLIVWSQPNIEYSVIQYNSKKGLKQNTVQAIFYTDDNRVLLSTFNGLIQFDGSRFIETPYSVNNNIKYFPRIVKTKNPNKYFVMDASHHIYQMWPSASQVQLPPYMNRIRELHAFDNMLYFITELNQIYSYNVTIKNLKEHKLPQLKGLSKLFSTTNHLFLNTNLQLFEVEKQLTTAKKIGLDSINVTKIVETATGDLYVLSNTELYHLNKKTSTLELIYNLPSQGTRSFFDFTVDNKENACIISPRVLYQLHIPTKTLKEINVKQHSPTYRTLSYNSELNQILIGTEADGMFVLKPNSIKAHTEENGFVDYGTTCITKDSLTNTVYIGTLGGNLFTYKDQILKPYTSFPENFTSLAVINNELWMGVYGGSILFNPDNPLSTSLKICKNAVTSIQLLSDGLVWIGHQDGLALVNTKKQIVKTFDTEIKTTITCLKEMDDGTIIAAGRSHIYFIRNQKIISHIGSKEGLNVNDIRCIHKTKSGFLLFGTYGKGLLMLLKGKIISINSYKGCLLPIDVFCLAKDKNANLWITTNNGLYCIEESKLEKFIRREMDYLIPKHFEEFYGLKNEEFNGGFMPNYCFTDKTLLLPNIKGFSEVKLDILNSEKHSVPITKIDEIVVNDTLKFTRNDAIVFPSNNSTLRILFFADNFKPSGNLHYQYKLEGIDQNWSAPILINEARYQLLPPGKYVFKVKAIDANSLNNLEDSVVITVEPSFFQTFTFRLFLFLFVFFLLAVIIAWRVRLVRKIAEEKSSYETRIAQVELRALHAQINPHFIFNCLNSIKYCVSENNFEFADKYIDHFSVLLRRFLEFSDKESIKISEEMEILMHYLELEKYRFDNKFTYQLEVDIDLRPSIIPTNIIQPLVENAIKHGIAHAEKICNLQIQIFKHKTFIRCIIDDDGIGRDASEIINVSFKKHTSKGLGLIHEKKEILKKISNIELEFEIIDKKNNLGESLGTQVIIDIPLEYDKSIDNRRRSNWTESD